MPSSKQKQGKEPEPNAAKAPTTNGNGHASSPAKANGHADKPHSRTLSVASGPAKPEVTQTKNDTAKAGVLGKRRKPDDGASRASQPDNIANGAMRDSKSVNGIVNHINGINGVAQDGRRSPSITSDAAVRTSPPKLKRAAMNGT